MHLYSDKWGHTRYFCCLPIQWLSWGGICALVWVASWISGLFFLPPWFFTWKKQFTDKLWLFRLVHLAEIISKTNGMSLSLQEYNWQYFLLMVGFEVQIKFRIEETFICHMSLTTLSYLQTFLNCWVVILPNLIFGYCTMKCISIWKVCIIF